MNPYRRKRTGQPWQLVIAASALAALVTVSGAWPAAYFVLKPVTTLLIIGYAYVFGREADVVYFRSMLLGLVACLVGDTLLLWTSGFPFGIGAFLVGHLLFLRAFLRLESRPGPWWPLLILAAYGSAFYGWLKPGLAELAVPVAVYVVVILLMGWRGWVTFFRQPGPMTRRIAAGVSLFMLSDSLLSIDKFAFTLPGAHWWVLTTYWTAVFLLAHSLVTRSEPEQ